MFSLEPRYSASPSSAKRVLRQNAAAMSATVKCVTWNVLADSYCSRNRSLHKAASSGSSRNSSSIPNAVDDARDIFAWSYRSGLTREVIAVMGADVLCLQEADHLEDFFEPLFEELQYSVKCVQRSGRRDGCLVAWRGCKFDLVEDQEVLFDDLVSYNSSSSSNGEAAVNTSVIDTLLQDFAKQNVAVMTKLRSKQGEGEMFVVACAHLHWNPSKSYVKEAQARYLLSRLGSFAGDLPILLAGDFNSLPDSDVYETILRGYARGGVSGDSDSLGDRRRCNDIVRSLVAHNCIPGLLFGKDTKFLCDYNLNKLCRYMRILGLDVALESFESKEMRSVGKSYMKSTSTKEKHSGGPPWRLPCFDLLFEHARREGRVLLTSSKDLMKRSQCPQSMFVKTSDLIGGIVDICRFYHISLEKDKFLTVCGKCGGKIEEMTREQVQGMAVTIHSASCYLPDDKEIFQCVDCRQPYWWNDSESSSPARAMRVAHELFETVTRRLAEGTSSSSGGSSSVTVEAETTEELKAAKRLFSAPSLDLQLKELFENRSKVVLAGEPAAPEEDAAEDTQQQPTPLRSAHRVANGCEPPFTNSWGDSFQGTLDYIFASPGVVVESSRAMFTCPALSSLPCALFPSDHLPVEAVVRFASLPDSAHSDILSL